MEVVMKLLISFLVVSGVAVAFPLTATAQTMDHAIVSAQDIKWSKGPSSIPQGAESAVLYGDPAKEGMFAFRLKFPKGYRIPPHSHPKPEIVTVISGTFRLGMGEVSDPSKAQVLPAGSYHAEHEPDSSLPTGSLSRRDAYFERRSTIG
jgi:quercetin dioxygenase-like cupin family protein